jgi:1-acyl-sn-glycerol-3-phosphate acyltransferase
VSAVTFCGALSVPAIAITGDGRLVHRIFARGWGRFILRFCGVRWRAEGIDRFDTAEPAVLVANHASHYAFYAIAAAFPVQWRAVMRRGMRRIPLFGYVGERAGHVFIRLGDASQVVEDIRAGGDRLREGYWLVVFPEGRPSPPRTILPFKRGAFRVAIDARAPIVPVAFEERYAEGDGRSWDAAPRELIMRIGDRIETKGLAPGDAAALAARARAAILGLLPGFSAPEDAPPDYPRPDRRGDS